MIKLFDRNSTKLTISEFYDNFEQGKYNFDVEYQRKSNVWSEDKRSFLIDSIMKNYPMPPVFMRPNVDNDTGKTKYDIVDGKQRLESIISFIKGEIPLTDYFWEDSIFLYEKRDVDKSEVEKEISGKIFDEIKADKKFADFIKQFWTYVINVDYLYQDDITMVANVFDRLNRSGEPLVPQELRNAKFHSSNILVAIKQLANHNYWKLRFEKLKKERMEDEEFISELFFLVAEDRFFDSSPKEIDRLYEEYSEKAETDITTIIDKFNQITTFIESLDIDYIHLKKLSWTTHLYGLFSIAWHCTKNNILANTIKDNLVNLYTEYFGKSSIDYAPALAEYKISCSSRTRSKDQREKRLNAIKKYCNI